MPKLQQKRSGASSSNQALHVVHHDYHDYAAVPAPNSNYDYAFNDTRNHNAFPYRLYEMLQLVERDGLDHIVSWQPHGRCFVVHKPEEFTVILPRYFKQSKTASFQRQLNLYNFQRLTKGADRGGYYNEFFLRGKEFLLNKIQRVKVKGTGVRAKSNPENEPDFYSLVWLPYKEEVARTVATMNPSRSVVVSDDDDDDHSNDDSESTALNSQHETKICAWGMSFYYIPSTGKEVPEEVWMNSEQVSDCWSNSDLEEIILQGSV
jgi:hypothetical protein